MNNSLPRQVGQHRILLTIAALVAGISLVYSCLIGMGHWLVVADPLEPARAIVVFGGHLPFRAMEAAAIFHKGLAPEVWLTRSVVHPEDVALAKLSIPLIPEYEHSRQVLERLGVPAASIKVLDERVEDTAEEVRAIAQEMQRVGGKRVILITSKYHSRRVRITWRKLTGDKPPAIVRYTRDDPFDPDRWWRSSHESLAVAREVFGIVNAWLGFPLHP